MKNIFFFFSADVNLWHNTRKVGVRISTTINVFCRSIWNNGSAAKRLHTDGDATGSQW